MIAPISPDRLAELEEERRFLLRSLADLEREHAAGDVDEVDYRELRDGYTARAAATLREIESGRASLPRKPPPNWRRRIVGVAVVVALVAGVWWALARSSAQRLPGEQITGRDPASEQQLLLAQARSIQLQDPANAAALYGLVLEDDPGNVEALAYRGWTLALSALASGATTDSSTGDAATDPGPGTEAVLKEAIDSLLAATDADPTYADPQCFLGVLYANFLDQPDLARPHVDACLAGNPPADVRFLVEDLADRLAG